MSKELLSVIIPVYNAETYLKRCLDSVTSQLYRDIEIICVNDGSTDNSPDILEEYKHRDKRLKIISQSNGGVVSARKTGINSVKGKYVTYIDADDYIDKDMYSSLMGYMEKYNVDLVTSGYIRTYGDSEIEIPEILEPGLYNQTQMHRVFKKFIDSDNGQMFQITFWNKIFKTNKIKDLQMKVWNNITLGDDLAVVYPYLIESDSIYVSGKSFYHYWVESGSLTDRDSTEGVIVREKEANDLLEAYLKDLIKEKSYGGIDINKQLEEILYFNNKVYVSSDIMKYENNILCPFGKVLKTDRILLYGAGKFGSRVKQYLDDNGFDVIAWVDNHSKKENTTTWETAKNMEYDLIIIGAINKEVIDSIKRSLEKDNIDMKNVLVVK